MSYLDNVKNKRTEIAEASQKQASLDAIEKLSSEIRTLLASLEKTGAKSLDSDFINAVKGLQNVANSLQSVKVTSDSDIKAALRTLTKAVNSIDVSPNIRVESPRVEVKERALDLSPIITAIKKIETKAPDVQIDVSGLTEGIKEVKKAIKDLSFPTSNYILPYKDASKSTQALVDSDGHIQADILSMPAVTVDTTGLATSSNQTSGDQKVQIVDSGGEAATVTSGKLDVNASIDTTGLATTLTDTNTSAIKTAVEILDNAISGSEMQVDVVTSALPTGAATAAKQPALGTAGTASADVLTVQGIASMTALKVDGSAVTQPVSGTFWQATQPVSLASAVTIQDGGNTITVDGTVTANLSATDNAVLDSIDVSTASKYITGIGHGVKTVTTAGTDVALATSTACKKVTIQAQTDNTGLIAVGASGVDATVATGTGVILYAGDAFEFDIDNLADIYIDSTVNGEGVRYVYFT